jgi:hypothetical protein
MSDDFAALIAANLNQTTSAAPPATLTPLHLGPIPSQDRHLVRRQVNRVEELDRRSTTLYRDVENIKAKLAHLSLQWSSQRLESELRRAATNILGPIMGNMHDQTRIELENIRGATNSAASRAEIAYSMASAAKSKVNSFEVQQSVPSISNILENVANNKHASNNTGEKRKDRDMLEEVMWERIDNHLACHELRLRKNNEQFIKAALKRAALEIEMKKDQKNRGNDHFHNSDNDQIGNNNRNSSGSSTRTFEGENKDHLKSAITTSDYLRLKRRIDDEILNISKFKIDLMKETKRDMEMWKVALGEEIRNRKSSVAKTGDSGGGGGGGSSSSNNNNSYGNVNSTSQGHLIQEQLGPILRSIQEQLDTFRNDFILHKLQVSTRFSHLEEDVQILRQAIHQTKNTFKQKMWSKDTDSDNNTIKRLNIGSDATTNDISKNDGGGNDESVDVMVNGTVSGNGTNNTSNTNNTNYNNHDNINNNNTVSTDNNSSTVNSPCPELRSIKIGNGRSLCDWGTNDVDRWLLKWGANDAVRQRFAEIEIDGEMLSLLERNDIEGDMGLLELTSARMVERLLEEIDILKNEHGIIDGDMSSPGSPNNESPKVSPKISQANQDEMDKIKKQLGELYGKK